MIALYSKTVRPDPDSESGSYTDNVLERNTAFCCDRFSGYCKKFPSWSYEKGRFTIVDSITYEGSSQTEIDYCPFCGERIKYKQNKEPKGKR